MNNLTGKHKIIGIGLVLLLIGGTYWIFSKEKELTLNTGENIQTVFMCTDAKKITAVFNQSPEESVSLTLSDARTLTLPSVISASGARYADEKETTVFWVKGNTAFLEENGSVTFAECTTDPVQATTTPKVTTPVKAPVKNVSASIPANYQTYSNATQKFSVSYPKGITPETQFQGFYFLRSEWRALATSEKRGTPVVAFPVFRVNNQNKDPKAYPLYFSAEVRVGVTKDTANCYTKDAGYTNQTVTDVTINGIAFKKFSFGDAGMNQYLEGNSYRTLKNGTCYVVEQLKTGSTYKDSSMSPGISDSALNSYYDVAGTVVRTFRFTN